MQEKSARRIITSRVWGGGATTDNNPWCNPIDPPACMHTYIVPAAKAGCCCDGAHSHDSSVLQEPVPFGAAVEDPRAPVVEVKR